MEKKRFVFSAAENALPLFIESIGFNPQEENFARPEGYPFYHWLQTIEGEGSISFENQIFPLPKGKGGSAIAIRPSLVLYHRKKVDHRIFNIWRRIG